MTTPRFRTVSLDALEELPVVDGTIRWKPLRRTLGIRAFGTNAYAADAGQAVVEPHDERDGQGPGGHEEMYVVVRGAARFTIDGEALEAPAGTVVFLPEPSAHREAVATADGTIVLAVGGRVGEAFTVSEWEDRFYREAKGEA